MSDRIGTSQDSNSDSKEDKSKDELMLEDYGTSDDNLEETYLEELESMENPDELTEVKQEFIEDETDDSETSHPQPSVDVTESSCEGERVNTDNGAARSTNTLGAFKKPLLVPGARRGSQLFTIGDGYFYYLKHKNRKRAGYRCYKWNCHARVSVLLENSMGVQRNPNFPWHNHDPDYFIGAANVLRETIISRCERESLPLRTIFDEECNQVPDEISKHLNFEKLASTLQKARKTSNTTPRLPKSPAEFHEILVCEEWPARSKTLNGKKFYRSNEVVEGKNNLIFVSENLEWLLEFAETLYLDESFKTVPSVPGLNHLLVVMALAYDHAFPVCYILMESGTYSSYKRIFSTIKHIVPGLKPETVISDFEMDLMKAVKEEFPDAETKGNWWHYAIRILNKAKALGIGVRLLRNEKIKKIIHIYMALPFLPPDKIEAGLEAARQFATQAAPATLAKKFKFLFAYIKSQWIQRVGADRLSVWGQPARTSNDSEVFHVSLEKEMKRGKPTAWEFVSGLKNLENVWANIPERLQYSQHSGRRKRKCLADEKVIKAAGKNLEIGSISEREFLTTVAEVISLRVNFPLQPNDEGEGDEVEEVERPSSPPEPLTPPPATEAVTADPVSSDVQAACPNQPLVTAVTTPSYNGVLWTDTSTDSPGQTVSSAVNTTSNRVNAVTATSNFTSPSLTCFSNLPAISTTKANASSSDKVPIARITKPSSFSATNTPVFNVASLPSVFATNTPFRSVASLPSVLSTNTHVFSVINSPSISVTNTPVIRVINPPSISAKNTPFGSVASLPSFFATNTPFASVASLPPILATNTPVVSVASLPSVFATNTPFRSAACQPSVLSTNTPVVNVADTRSASANDAPVQPPANNSFPPPSDCEDSEGVFISLKKVPLERRKKTEDKLLRLVKLISELDLDPDGVSFIVTTK